MAQPDLTRRTFLRSAGALTAGMLAGYSVQAVRYADSPSMAGSGASAAVGGRAWSDPATWGGRVPAPGDDVTIDGDVFLDVDATVVSLTVPAGSSLSFDPDTSRTLESRGNVVVAGILRMRPGSASAVHTLRFLEVSRSGFRGGGMAILDSDIGLWVTGAGSLDAQGMPKTAWTRAAGDLVAGQNTIDVEDAAGWRVGDEVVVTPTEPISEWQGAEVEHHDRRSIKEVSGNRVILDSGLGYPHPEVDGRWPAEVINLSRNVRIEGQPDAESHVVFLMAERPQTVRHAELRYLAPGALGRYALHFHHCGTGSVGSVIEGVVAHDLNGHAFVPHGSHGVAFRGCAAHESVGAAYWWDPSERTDGTLYEGCIASCVRHDGTFTNTGFFAALGGAVAPWGEQEQQAWHDYLLEAGAAPDVGLNTMRGCVASGVQGPDSSGFFWNNGSQGVWVFEDNLAHNCGHLGVRVWQNTAIVHPIDRTQIYHCWQGVDHGAYGNPYLYRTLQIYGCDVGLEQHAQSKPSQDSDIDLSPVTAGDQPVGQPMRFHDVTATGCATALRLTVGARQATLPADYRRCSFPRVVIDLDRATNCLWDFVDCGLAPEDVTVTQTSGGSFRLRAQDDGRAWEMLETGEITPIQPFS